MVGPVSATRIRAPRFIHLSEYQGCLSSTLTPHLGPQVISLTGTLSHAREMEYPPCSVAILVIIPVSVRSCPHLRRQRDLFFLLGIGGQQINYLNTSLQHLHNRALVLKRRRVPVDDPLISPSRLSPSMVSPNTLKRRPRSSRLQEPEYRRLLAPLPYPCTGRHGCQHNAAHHIAAYMLGHFHDALLTLIIHQGILDMGSPSSSKATSTTGPMTCIIFPCSWLPLLLYLRIYDCFFLCLCTADYLMISWVIAACLTQLYYRQVI